MVSIPVSAEAFRALHAKMKMRYPFPPIDELIVVKAAVGDQSGNVIAGGMVRVVGEAYLFVDPDTGKATRTEAIRMLHKDLAEKSKKEGLTDVSAWLPPQVFSAGSGFVPLLEELGWKRSPWPSWSILL